MENDFEILSISETWFNSSVTNASVEILGYRIFRLHCVGKIGASVCAYVNSALKVWPTFVDSTANKKLRLLLVCFTYRPTEIGFTCLQNE